MGGGTTSYQEIEETDLLVLWGSNARETHPIFFHRVLKGIHNGARLYVVDPRLRRRPPPAGGSTSSRSSTPSRSASAGSVREP